MDLLLDLRTVALISPGSPFGPGRPGGPFGPSNPAGPGKPGYPSVPGGPGGPGKPEIYPCSYFVLPFFRKMVLPGNPVQEHSSSSFVLSV